MLYVHNFITQRIYYRSLHDMVVWQSLEFKSIAKYGMALLGEVILYVIARIFGASQMLFFYATHLTDVQT